MEAEEGAPSLKRTTSLRCNSIHVFCILSLLLNKLTMQDNEGKAVRKSEEITATPTRASLAKVTPRTTANERVQAQAKKAKKKGLEGYFGTGARVPPPTLEGTPTDAAGKRGGGEKTASGRNKGEGERSTVPRTDGSQAVSNQGGEGKQRRCLVTSTTPSKKSPRNASDDEHSRRSKKTRSDDEVSSPEESGGVDTANLEAIKGSLRKKGSGTTSPKGPNKSNKTDKKKATFAEVAKKSVPRNPAPAIKLKKCVVAFSVRVDKGKDTQAAFGKKLISPFHFYKLILTRMPYFLQSMNRTPAGHPSKRKPISLFIRSSCADTLRFPMRGPSTM